MRVAKYCEAQRTKPLPSGTTFKMLRACHVRVDGARVKESCLCHRKLKVASFGFLSLNRFRSWL